MSPTLRLLSLAVIGLLCCQAAAAPFLFGLEHAIRRVALRDPAVPTFPSQVTLELDLTITTEQGVQSTTGHIATDLPNKRMHSRVELHGGLETVQLDTTTYSVFMGQCHVSKDPAGVSDINRMLKGSTFAGYEDVRGVKCQKFTFAEQFFINTFYFRDADQTLMRFTVSTNGTVVQTMDVKSLVAGAPAESEFVVRAEWACPSSPFNHPFGFHKLVHLHPAVQPFRLRDPVTPTFPTQFVAEFDVQSTTPQGSFAGSYHLAWDSPKQRQHMVVNFGAVRQESVMRDGKFFNYYLGQCEVSQGASIPDPNEFLKAAHFAGFEDVAGTKCQKFEYEIEDQGVSQTFYFKDSDQSFVRMVLKQNDQSIQVMDLKSLAAGAIADAEFVVPSEWHCPSVL